jgi:hypothetical protein
VTHVWENDLSPMSAARHNVPASEVAIGMHRFNIRRWSRWSERDAVITVTDNGVGKSAVRSEPLPFTLCVMSSNCARANREALRRTNMAFNDDFLAYKDPGFARTNLCSIILNSSWG